MSQEIVKIEDIVGGADIELTTNKTYDVNASSTDEQYPSAKAVHLAVDEKVDKETGKGLSTNDYTTTEKNKLAGIAAGAEVNVNADWNAVSGDAQILNKPTLAPSDAEKNIIVGVQKNGTDLVPDVNRKVNVTVPTQPSDIGAEPAKGTDDNYVTDAEKIVLSNTSGTNTGDQDLSGLSLNTHRHDGETLIPDVVEFQTPAVIPTALGSMYYDAAKKVLSTVLDGAILQNGLELYVRIVNKTGVQINDGQAVYISGAQGNRPTVSLAIATNNVASNVIGVATQNIANNAEGFITVFGDVDFNTTGLTDGATLYLSAVTAGALTESEPAFSNHKVCVATVLNSTTNGRIFVRPFHVFELAELHGVDLTETTPLDTDSILIQQTSTGKVKKSLFSTLRTFLNTYFLKLDQTIAQTLGSAAARVVNIYTSIINASRIDSKGYIYTNTTSDTADTINDRRETTTSGVKRFERCTVANATKGSGTWVLDASVTVNGNIAAPNFIEGFTTTATANGTTTLTIASTFLQYFTGILNQTITLPTTTVVTGVQYLITNLSTGNLTVNASGGTNVIVIPANSSVLVTALVATPTTSAQWSYSYAGQASDILAGALLIANATDAALGINDTKAMTALKTLLYGRINYPMYEGSYADINLNAFNFFNDGSMLNSSGGFMTRSINKTGAASVKGTIVTTSSTTDNAVMVNPIDGDYPCGVMFEDGVPDGSPCWVVTSGRAQCLLVNSVATTRNYIAYSSATVAGRIDTAASAPASLTHFRETGHTNESKTAGTNILVWCFLHFN